VRILVHQPHRPGLADVITTEFAGPIPKARLAHEVKQRLRLQTG